MKKYGYLIISYISMMAILCGCMVNRKQAKYIEHKEKFKIGVLFSSLNNTFFREVQQGIEEESARLGYEVNFYHSKDTLKNESKLIEILVKEDIDVLLLNPVDEKNSLKNAHLLKEKKIPVFLLDRHINSSDIEVISTISSNHKSGGKQVADYFITQLNGKGNIIQVIGNHNGSSIKERKSFFEEEIKNHSEIKIVKNLEGNFDSARAKEVVSEYLKKEKKEIHGVFVHNDEMVKGVQSALSKLKSENVIIVGYDGTEEGLKQVKSGKIHGTVSQQPRLLGKYAIKTIHDYLNKEKVDKNIILDAKFIAKEEK